MVVVTTKEQNLDFRQLVEQYLAQTKSPSAFSKQFVDTYIELTVGDVNLHGEMLAEFTALCILHNEMAYSAREAQNQGASDTGVLAILSEVRSRLEGMTPECAPSPNIEDLPQLEDITTIRGIKIHEYWHGIS